MRRTPLQLPALLLLGWLAGGCASDYEAQLVRYCASFGTCTCGEAGCCLHDGVACDGASSCCEGSRCEDGVCRPGPTPALTVAPPVHDFGLVAPGSTPAPARFEVTNTGVTPTGRFTVALVEAEEDRTVEFGPAAGSCLEAELAPGERCTVLVPYTPRADRAASALLLRDARGSTGTATLSGHTVTPLRVHLENAPAKASVQASADGWTSAPCYAARCEPEFPLGARVRLKALVESGLVEVRWEAPGCSGSSTTCEVQVAVGTEVRAIFP